MCSLISSHAHKVVIAFNRLPLPSALWLLPLGLNTPKSGALIWPRLLLSAPSAVHPRSPGGAALILLHDCGVWQTTGPTSEAQKSPAQVLCALIAAKSCAFFVCCCFFCFVLSQRKCYPANFSLGVTATGRKRCGRARIRKQQLHDAQQLQKRVKHRQLKGLTVVWKPLCDADRGRSWQRKSFYSPGDDPSTNSAFFSTALKATLAHIYYRSLVAGCKNNTPRRSSTCEAAVTLRFTV